MLVSINYNGNSGADYKRPTNEGHLIANKINFYRRQSCKFLLNWIINFIVWLWNNQIWIVLSDNDWRFGLFDECARGTHYREIMCDGLQEPNFMGRFFPYLGDGFQVKLHWTFWKCLICTTCLVRNMSEMVLIMSVKHVWIWNVKRSWDGKPRDCQLREGSPHSSLTKKTASTNG